MREPRKQGKKLFTDVELGPVDEKVQAIHDSWTAEAKLDEQIARIKRGELHGSPKSQIICDA